MKGFIFEVSSDSLKRREPEKMERHDAARAGAIVLFVHTSIYIYKPDRDWHPPARAFGAFWATSERDSAMRASRDSAMRASDSISNSLRSALCEYKGVAENKLSISKVFHTVRERSLQYWLGPCHEIARKQSSDLPHHWRTSRCYLASICNDIYYLCVFWFNYKQHISHTQQISSYQVWYNCHVKKKIIHYSLACARTDAR